jgi:hypothetical protein
VTDLAEKPKKIEETFRNLFEYRNANETTKLSKKEIHALGFPFFQTTAWLREGLLRDPGKEHKKMHVPRKTQDNKEEKSCVWYDREERENSVLLF